MSTTFSLKTVTTRKDHRCCGCDTIVTKGSRMSTWRGIVEYGYPPQTSWYCMVCATMWEIGRNEIDPCGEGIDQGILGSRDFEDLRMRARIYMDTR